MDQESQENHIPIIFSKDKIAEALSKAQAEIKPPEKNRIVDYTDRSGRRVKYKYAGLADVFECIKVPFKNHGLSVTQTLEYVLGNLVLRTQILHSSGQSIDSSHPLPDPQKQSMKPQEFGSSLTYARRYSLCAIVGIEGEEDDDGQVAQAVEPKKQTKKGSSKPPEIVSNDGDFKEFKDKMYDSSPLDELVWLSAKKNLVKQMPEIIKKVTGSNKKAKELSEPELLTVLSYVRMK